MDGNPYNGHLLGSPDIFCRAPFRFRRFDLPSAVASPLTIDLWLHHLAATAVLATFMAGPALGAGCIARIKRKIGNSPLLFAGVEATVAFYAVILSGLLKLLDQITHINRPNIAFITIRQQLKIGIVNNMFRDSLRNDCRSKKWMRM